MRRKLNILCMAVPLLACVVAALWVRSNTNHQTTREALMGRVETALAEIELAQARAQAQGERIDQMSRPTVAEAETAESSRLIAGNNGLMAAVLQDSRPPYGRILTGLLALLYVLVMYGDWLRNRERRRLQKGLCPACGYDLRASPDRCPECGTTDMKLPLQPEQIASS